MRRMGPLNWAARGWFFPTAIWLLSAPLTVQVQNIGVEGPQLRAAVGPIVEKELGGLCRFATTAIGEARIRRKKQTKTYIDSVTHTVTRRIRQVKLDLQPQGSKAGSMATFLSPDILKTIAASVVAKISSHTCDTQSRRAAASGFSTSNADSVRARRAAVATTGEHHGLGATTTYKQKGKRSLPDDYVRHRQTTTVAAANEDKPQPQRHSAPDEQKVFSRRPAEEERVFSRYSHLPQHEQQREKKQKAVASEASSKRLAVKRQQAEARRLAEVNKAKKRRKGKH